MTAHLTLLILCTAVLLSLASKMEADSKTVFVKCTFYILENVTKFVRSTSPEMSEELQSIELLSQKL